MARIPRAQEMGLGDNQAQLTRGVVDVPTIDQSGLRAGAEALSHVGDQILEFSSRIQKAAIDRSVTEANITARDQLDKLQRSLAESGEDPTTFEQRWVEGSQKIVSDVAKMVPPGGRDLWTQRARESAQEGLFKTRSLARTRQLESEQAKAITIFEGVRDSAGDLSISADTYAGKVKDAHQLVNDQLAAGIIGKDDAAKRHAELDDAQVVDNTLRFTANIDSLIKDGRVAEAEALYQAQMGLNSKGITPVDNKTLAQLKSGLDAAKQDYAVVAKGDEFWAAAKGDYGKAIKLAGAITDAPLRTKVEQRLGQMAQQAKAAEEVRQDGLERSLWKHVVEGGTIMNAAPSLRAAIDPGRMGAIRAYENARDAEKTMSPASMAQWKDDSARIRMRLESSLTMPPQVFMSNPATWPQEYFTAYQSMTADDQRAVDEKRQTMTEKSGSVDEVTRIEKLLWDEAKRVAPSGWDLNSQRDQKTPQFNEAAGLIREQAALMAKDMGGKPLTPDEVRQNVGFAFGRMKDGENLNIARWAAYGENFRPKFNQDVNAIGGDTDPDLYGEAFKAVQAKYPGQMPPMAEVRAAYNQLVAAAGQ